VRCTVTRRTHGSRSENGYGVSVRSQPIHSAGRSQQLLRPGTRHHRTGFCCLPGSDEQLQGERKGNTRKHYDSANIGGCGYTPPEIQTAYNLSALYKEGFDLSSAARRHNGILRRALEYTLNEGTVELVTFGTDSHLQTAPGWDDVTGVGVRKPKAFADFFKPAP
jgi:hypothetical protein